MKLIPSRRYQNIFQTKMAQNTTQKLAHTPITIVPAVQHWVYVSKYA